MNCSTGDVEDHLRFSAHSMNSQNSVDASPLADAIIDRIAHDSSCINITSIDATHDISMREIYGFDKTLRE